jgi:hypothetical protein
MKNIHRQPDGMNSGNQQQGDDFNQQPKNVVGDNTIKDPDEWKTGDEPMTGAQKSYMETLASEAGEKTEENLTKAEASKKIDELRQKTGRSE